MPADKVFLNGSIVPRAEALVSAFDRGLLYGDGFFETIRILRHRALLLDRHLARLRDSCRQTGFGDGADVGLLAEGVKRLIEANGVEAGYLRITVSRGPYAGRLTELDCAAPTALIEARSMDLPPLDDPPPWTLVRSRYRQNENSPVVPHKSLSYQANLLALAEGREAGADEVYFLNGREELTEGAISNLFFVRDGVVCTPELDCGLLPGITRAVVLELCSEHGIPCETGAYGEPLLLNAEEAFCTNSLRGIVPVERVLGPPKAVFTSGPVTSSLQSHYAAFVAAV
jgi:branched-subunit amino acid aminotransferase/4-amino-4-deoxychorismate lyase